MTATNNQELIDLLKLTRDKHLTKDDSPDTPTKDNFVCYAISKAHRARYGYGNLPQKLRSLVKQHIGSCATMESFLWEKFGNKALNTPSRNVQKWRVLMINSMIKMLEAEGKKA